MIKKRYKRDKSFCSHINYLQENFCKLLPVLFFNVQESNMYEVTLLHEGIFLHGVIFARGVTFAQKNLHEDTFERIFLVKKLISLEKNNKMSIIFYIFTPNFLKKRKCIR